jgi:hypothetical protein
LNVENRRQPKIFLRISTGIRASQIEPVRRARGLAQRLRNSDGASHGEDPSVLFQK